MKEINYNKKCPHCNGKPYRLKEGKPIGFIFKEPDTILVCPKCKGEGFI